MLIPIIATLVIAGIIYWFIQMLPLPEPFPMLIKIVVVITVILYLLRFLGAGRFL